MLPAGSLKEQLEQYVDRVKERYEECRGNEAQTKMALIVPLFTILGYDVTDPRECRQEYKTDFGENRGKEPVDWAFRVNDAWAFLVEAKAVGKDLPAFDEQLGDYFGKSRPPVRLGILTNGIHWRFFTDLDLVNKMDVQPFLEWDVLKGKDAIPYEFLTILQRAKVDPEYIKTFATKRYRQSLLVAELSAILKPSPEFVKFALKNLGPRTVTAAVINEWTPTFVMAIQEWAQQQRLTEALEDTSDTPDGDQPPAPDYREFWEPIRREGLFAGKLSGDAAFTKWVRRIGISLVVRNNACRVELSFDGEDRQERRDRALELFPAAKYPREVPESPGKWVSVRFRVLDKGIKDRDNWPEIREKLTQLGADIYNKLSKSDV